MCDDDVSCSSYLCEKLAEYGASRGIYMDVAVFSSAEAFLFDYEDHPQVDVLLLDVEMGTMNGVDLAKELRRRKATMPIVFITGYPDYMADGYDVSALHYLLKPVQKEKLFEVLQKAFDAVVKSSRTLLLPDGQETVCIQEDAVLYAEAQGHYCILHLTDTTVRLRMTLATFLEHGGNAFCKCGRSYAVGLRYVRRVTKTTVQLTNGAQLPLGKEMYDAVNTALVRFVRTM